MKVIEGGSGVASSGLGERRRDNRPVSTPKTHSVLFLSDGNTISSIFAEAILKSRGGKDFKSFSAETRPTGEINPLARDILKTIRMWNDELRSKSFDLFLTPDAPRMDYVISVGERPPDGLPAAWPGNPQVIHWRISDPRTDGKPIENERSLRKVLGELETRIKLFMLVHQREARMAAKAA